MDQEATDKQELDLQSVLHWIMDNCDDEPAMEKINKATFPFTGRYEKYSKPKPKKPDFDDEFDMKGFDAL